MSKLFYADDDVDDIETFVEAVQQIEQLNGTKIELNVYSSGKDLIKDLKDLKPKEGIVFLDINMPIKNGFEVLDEIREDANLCTLPVIMYSTSSDKRAIQTSLDLGANLYAIKPSSIKDLRDIIKNVIEINWNEFMTERLNFVINKNL